MTGRESWCNSFPGLGKAGAQKQISWQEFGASLFQLGMMVQLARGVFGWEERGQPRSGGTRQGEPLPRPGAAVPAVRPGAGDSWQLSAMCGEAERSDFQCNPILPLC